MIICAKKGCGKLAEYMMCSYDEFGTVDNTISTCEKHQEDLKEPGRSYTIISIK